MTAAGAAIAVRGLHKSYGGRPAVAGLDLDVAPGTIVALLGPNGAGKTTTVEIVEGYRRADAGEVRVLGLDPWRDGPALRARVGLMLQAGGIYPQARPAEILRLYARFYRDPLDPDALLDQAGLTDSARVPYRVLSGGQRQRLGLALAIVGRPELVLLDEPTAGLDPAAKAATRDLIASLRDAGVSVLLTTHELADAERLADRIAIVDRGRIVAEGRPAELTLAAARLRVRLRPPAVRWRPGRARSRARRGPVGRWHAGPARRRRWGRALPPVGGRSEPVAGRDVECLVRRARHPHRRAADRRIDPRGALPRADRRARPGRPAMSLGWTPSAGGNGAPAGRATVAQVGMELRLLSRRGENLFVTLVVPLVLLVFFSIVPATDRGGVAFLLPGILALAIVSTSLVNLGISTAFERSYGVLKRLGGSPLPRTGLIAAKISTVVVVEIGQAILLVGVAALGLGWSPGPDANVLVCLAAFGLGTLAFAGLGLFLAGSLRAEATLAIANGLFLAMILLGGVVLPVDHLPGILADLARVLPASALSDAFRIGLGASTGDPLGPLVVLAAWAAGLTVLAARTFRWE